MKRALAHLVLLLITSLVSAEVYIGWTRNGGIRVNQNPSTDEGVEFHGTFHSLVHSNGSFYPIEAYLELKRDNEGATQYAELEHIHQVEALVASNDHAIFAIDTQSGEDVWSVEFTKEQPLRHVSRREELIVAITGKNDEMIHAFDIQTGERIWQLKPKFEDYHRDSADKPKSGMAGHRAVLHSDVAFMDHDVHSEKDKRHQVDVLWLAGGETLIRIDGVTGDIIWRWDSDLGWTTFHRICTAVNHVYLIGSDLSADVHQKAELSIVGFHPSTGSRQSTNFVNVLIDTHHHAPFDSNLFYKSVFVSGSYDDRYVVWKVRLQNGVDMDAGIYSINSDHTASLRDLTGPLFTPSCNDFSVIPLNSENIHMNEIAIECPGLGEYWIANIEENLSNGHVEAKNFFQIAKPQMPSAASLLSSHLPRQEFDEEVYAISRVYMLAQDNDRPYYTDCVIDIYDLRSGKDVLNLEIDLSKSKLGVGETISKAFMIPFIIKTTGITNWNLIIVTTSGRWINFFSNHKTETPVMKKTAYNTGAASPRPRFALIHDEL